MHSIHHAWTGIGKGTHTSQPDGTVRVAFPYGAPRRSAPVTALPHPFEAPRRHHEASECTRWNLRQRPTVNLDGHGKATAALPPPAVVSGPIKGTIADMGCAHGLSLSEYAKLQFRS
jgi:hypothetical protein